MEVIGFPATTELNIAGVNQIDLKDPPKQQQQQLQQQQQQQQHQQQQQQQQNQPKPPASLFGCGQSGHNFKNCRKTAIEVRNKSNCVPSNKRPVRSTGRIATTHKKATEEQTVQTAHDSGKRRKRPHQTTYPYTHRSAPSRQLHSKPIAVPTPKLNGLPMNSSMATQPQPSPKFNHKPS